MKRGKRVKLNGNLHLDHWRHFSGRKLIPVRVKQSTGFCGTRWRSAVPTLRQAHYVVVDQSVTGDAPKDFIRVYEYGVGSRRHPDSWPAHIAKVGHKWYPAESVTEQLMTRVGQEFGLRMASSQLMECNSQIRFLSRYFLVGDESLVHGAEIVGGYVEDDSFVETVGKEELERDIFTFEVLCTAIRAKFPKDADSILIDFVRMIGFDAIVGNQDRHLFNWGVIVHPKGSHRPRFSPIYDTARGLFWNTSEDGLERFEKPEALSKYVEKATPLIGWDGIRDPNHFAMVGYIAGVKSEYREALRTLCDDSRLHAIFPVIDREFVQLLSLRRREVIKRCLQLRLQLVKEALEGAI